MDEKLKKIYDLYLKKGLITEKITFDQWSAADEDQQVKLYDLGKTNGLFDKVEVDQFKTLWSGMTTADPKKKVESPVSSQEEVMESDIQVQQEDEEWCQFDNFMISCLQLYLENGLLKSTFVNLELRRLSAETSHEFVEWCGLLDGKENNKLVSNTKILRNDLYFDFIDEYPDYGPKARMTISRQRFYKWIDSYSIYKYKSKPIEGRDKTGKWIEFCQNVTQTSLI